MNERLSIIIPSEMNEDLEELQKLLKMDKSSVIRYLLSKSIREEKISAMLEAYKRGKLSLGKAAELARVNIGEFIEDCNKNQIQLDFSEEEAELGIKTVETFNLKAYKKKFEDLK